MDRDVLGDIPICQQLSNDEELLGRGGFGLVYKKWCNETGKLVAVKKLQLHIQSRSSKAILLEAQTLFAVKHENVVPLLGVEVHSGVDKIYNLVMEYMPHGSLSNFLQDTSDIPWGWCYQVLLEVATGMQYLHNMKPKALIHCDLKADNVLLSSTLSAKISDFGSSVWKHFETAMSSGGVQTQSGRGTITHVAPEWLGNLDLRQKPSLDVYSYGILMWEVITKSIPYENALAQPKLIEQGVRDGQRPSMNKLPTKSQVSQYRLHEEVVPLMKKCWTHNPKDRPSSEDIMTSLRTLIGMIPDIKKETDVFVKSHIGTHGGIDGLRDNYEESLNKTDEKTIHNSLPNSTNNTQRGNVLSDDNNEESGQITEQDVANPVISNAVLDESLPDNIQRGNITNVTWHIKQILRVGGNTFIILFILVCVATWLSEMGYGNFPVYNIHDIFNKLLEVISSRKPEIEDRPQRLQNFSASTQDNEKWNFCCERGSLVELSGMDTCEEKADSVMLWGACKNAFVDCCIAKNNLSLLSGWSDEQMVTNRSVWQARPPNGSTDKRIDPFTHVIVAHTVTNMCKTPETCKKAVQDIQNYHMSSKGFSDIGYNFLIGGDDVIYEGRGFNMQGAHSLRWNKKGLGIAFIGQFSVHHDNPTSDMLRALRRVIAVAVENKILTKDYILLGHCQVRPFESPGFNVFNELQKHRHWMPGNWIPGDVTVATNQQTPKNCFV